MKVNIFYSWQSDKKNIIIQEAAQLAINRIVSGDDFEVEAALDRDTKDIPGSPAIAEAILSKIDKCSLFLCDITIVTETSSKRKSPNPNVLIELGYAAARIGWERIICVMNEAYGEAKELPFDIQHRRWPIRFKLADNADKVKVDEIKVALSQNIELAIRSVLQSGVLTQVTNPKDHRVATKLNNALNNFVGELTVFLTSHGYANGMKIILDDHLDEPGSKYPSPVLVDEILNVLANNTLKSASNVQIGGNQVSWAEAFIGELANLHQGCNQILDQYADRDDNLISMVDEVSNRSKTLASILSTCLNVPNLSMLYDKGVPDVHIEYFRYFLLSIIKSYRIIRQFGVEVR
jgi:hypothetical protein